MKYKTTTFSRRLTCHLLDNVQCSNVCYRKKNTLTEKVICWNYEIKIKYEYKTKKFLNFIRFYMNLKQPKNRLKFRKIQLKMHLDYYNVYNFTLK